VNIKGSDFVEIVNNEIASNGEDGIRIESFDGGSSHDILIDGNWVHANGSQGVSIENAYRVTVLDNLIESNANDGVLAANSNDVYVGFNIIRDHGGSDDGVVFNGSTGVIEGNEIYNNDDGVYVDGDGGFNGLVDVLGNIIRDNDADGVDFKRRRLLRRRQAMAPLLCHRRQHDRGERRQRRRIGLRQRHSTGRHVPQRHQLHQPE